MASQTQDTNTIRYFTKDTLLATWLYMNGLKYEGVTKDNPSQVIFNANKDELKHLLDEFDAGNPHGNIITFFRSYKYLLSQIMDR
jgi:hypothetical protein